MTNNVAEYEGLIAAFELVEKMPARNNIIIRGDSKLVINQMSGRWRVKSGAYKGSFRRAMDKLRTFPQSCGFRFQWVAREENSEADELSKAALRKRGIVGR